MEPIQLLGEAAEFAMPGDKKFSLPLPTAYYDLLDVLEEGKREAAKKTRDEQDAASEKGEDIPPEIIYNDREFLADIIEYVRKATTNNGTEGVELNESQAWQVWEALPLVIGQAKKKRQEKLDAMLTLLSPTK